MTPDGYDSVVRAIAQIDREREAIELRRMIKATQRRARTMQGSGSGRVGSILHISPYHKSQHQF